MYLTAEEQERLLNRSDHISQENFGARRWSEGTATVVRADDGKFYRITWDRGLTEMQEDSFSDGEVPEVFPVVTLEVERTVSYLTDEEQAEQRPSLAHKVEDEAASYSIATGKDIREPLTEELYNLAAELRESLDILAPLDLAANSGPYREATKQYLDTIIGLWEGVER